MINPNKNPPLPRYASQWMLVGLRGGAVTPPGLSDGDPVTSWTDSSGNGNHAVMTGSNRPTFKTAIVNGKPVVRFTTAGVSKLNLTTPISGVQPWIVFAVMKQVAGSRIDTLAGNGTSGTPLGATILSTNDAFFYTREGYVAQVGGPMSAAFHVLEGINAGAAGGSKFLLVDGVNVGGAFTAVANTGDFVTIGYESITPAYYNGDIAEIIIYAAAISGTDRVNVETYLGNKYAITVPGGGTVVQPDTVASLVGWWKADSLGT